MTINKGFGFLFEMGCGKTLTAIAVAGAGYKQGRIRRMLIVAPTSVVAVWPKEFQDYAAFPYTIKTLLGTKDQRLKALSDLERFPYPHLQVAVINYESTWRPGIIEALLDFDADLIVADESQRIADRAGIALVYEATPPISIKRVEQSNQDDCEFYNKLVGEYGLQLKIYNNRLVVFSEADYEAKAPKVTLTEADFDPNWSFNTSLLGVYTGVKYQYTNPDKNKTYTVEAGDGNRILTCNDAADNLGEAISVALAAINKANRGTTTMTLTMKAIPGLIATDCVAIVGLQKLDGKYYIEKITHSVGSGYKMALTLRRVEKRFTSPTKAVESSA